MKLKIPLIKSKIILQISIKLINLKIIILVIKEIILQEINLVLESKFIMKIILALKHTEKNQLNLIFEI
jgi:hypothetical protein